MRVCDLEAMDAQRASHAHPTVNRGHPLVPIRFAQWRLGIIILLVDKKAAEMVGEFANLSVLIGEWSFGMVAVSGTVRIRTVDTSSVAGHSPPPSCLLR